MEDQALSLDPALYDLGFPERGELPARAPSSGGRGLPLPLPLPPPRLRAAAGRDHVSAARRRRGPDFRAAEGDAAA